jgi:hypothetical protein
VTWYASIIFVLVSVGFNPILQVIHRENVLTPLLVLVMIQSFSIQQLQLTLGVSENFISPRDSTIHLSIIVLRRLLGRS